MHAEAGQGEEAELQENVRTGPFLERRKACVLREARETMWKKTPKPAAPGRGPEGTGEGLERTFGFFLTLRLSKRGFRSFQKADPGAAVTAAVHPLERGVSVSGHFRPPGVHGYPWRPQKLPRQEPEPGRSCPAPGAPRQLSSSRGSEARHSWRAAPASGKRGL